MTESTRVDYEMRDGEGNSLCFAQDGAYWSHIDDLDTAKVYLLKGTKLYRRTITELIEEVA